MPLDSASLSANCKFSFVVPGSDWANLTQGNNQITFGGTIDPTVWNQAYAAVLPIAGGANTTIDLKNFTNLAGETVALTKVLAAVVKNVPTVAASANCPLKITPGTSNGLVWFAGSTDGLVLKASESFELCGNSAGTGVTVDTTHKTIRFANTGTDAATVTVVILGSTL